MRMLYFCPDHYSWTFYGSLLSSACFLLSDAQLLSLTPSDQMECHMVLRILPIDMELSALCLRLLLPSTGASCVADSPQICADL